MTDPESNMLIDSLFDASCREEKLKERVADLERLLSSAKLFLFGTIRVVEVGGGWEVRDKGKPGVSTWKDVPTLEEAIAEVKKLGGLK